MCVCASFQAKQTAFTFSAQIGRNVDLELEIQKTIVGMRISILDITCVPMFSLNATTLNISAQSFPMDNFEFLGLNLGKLPNYMQYFGSNIVEGVAES